MTSSEVDRIRQAREALAATASRLPVGRLEMLLARLEASIRLSEQVDTAHRVRSLRTVPGIDPDTLDAVMEKILEAVPGDVSDDDPDPAGPPVESL